MLSGWPTAVYCQVGDRVTSEWDNRGIRTVPCHNQSLTEFLFGSFWRLQISLLHSHSTLLNLQSDSDVIMKGRGDKVCKKGRTGPGGRKRLNFLPVSLDNNNNHMIMINKHRTINHHKKSGWPFSEGGNRPTARDKNKKKWIYGNFDWKFSVPFRIAEILQ